MPRRRLETDLLIKQQAHAFDAHEIEGATETTMKRLADLAGESVNEILPAPSPGRNGGTIGRFMPLLAGLLCCLCAAASPDSGSAFSAAFAIHVGRIDSPEIYHKAIDEIAVLGADTIEFCGERRAGRSREHEGVS